MADFEERGGELVVGPTLEAADVERISRDHDLVVVAVGRGSIGGMFRRRPEKSPYDRPQRRLCAGLYHGIAPTEPRGVSFCIAPGHGELLELPLLTREGHATALLFENIPGGETERLVDMSVEDDVAALRARGARDRPRSTTAGSPTAIDQSSFRLMGPGDVLQGALTPVVREDYVQLSSTASSRSRWATRTSSSTRSSARAPTRRRTRRGWSARRSSPTSSTTSGSAGASPGPARSASWASPTGPTSCSTRRSTSSGCSWRCRRTASCATRSAATGTGRSATSRPSRRPERTHAFMARHTAGSPALAA